MTFVSASSPAARSTQMKAKRPSQENESAYLHYETWLREQESARGILAMASGSLFALRRSLWQPLEADLGDDFVLPLRVTAANKLNVLEPRVVSVTSLAQTKPGTRFSLKVRIISKDFRALCGIARCSIPCDTARLQCLSLHKLLRWFVPYFLVVVRCKSVSARRPFFRATLALQIGFYIIAFAGLFARAGGAFPLVGSDVLLRGERCGLLGILKCLAGRKSGRWTPQRKQSVAMRSAPPESHHAH